MKWGRGKGQIFTLKSGRGGGIYFLNETSACALNLVFHSACILKPSTVRQTHTSPQVENTSNPAKVKKQQSL